MFTIHRLRTLLILLPCLDSPLHCTALCTFYFCIFAFAYSIFIFIHLLLFCVFLSYFFIVFFRVNNACTNWGNYPKFRVLCKWYMTIKPYLSYSAGQKYWHPSSFSSFSFIDNWLFASEISVKYIKLPTNKVIFDK